MAWYVLQLKPAQGDRALQHLQNQDITCFYPKVAVERIRAGRRQKRLEPLFPGYLFINLETTDARWSKLRSTRGVLRVVSFAHRPAPVADALIEQIRQNLDTLEEQGGLKPGQAIQIKEGPFKGLQAIFKAYEGEERALILIELLHKQQELALPLNAITS